MSINGLNDSPDIVTVPPRDTEDPLMVMLELVRLVFPTFIIVLLVPEMVLFVKTEDDVKVGTVAVSIAIVGIGPVLLVIEIPEPEVTAVISPPACQVDPS